MTASYASPWSYVRGFQPLSLCDWPGHTSCVIFLGGCNLRCPTCHNSEIAFTPDENPQISRDHIVKYIKARSKWLDGIVVSGGEPTCVDDLPFLLRELRGFGLPIKVDSNGMKPLVIESLLSENLADAFFVDVKGPYHAYPALTGHCVDEETAKGNLEHIFYLSKRAPEKFLFRLTKVPMLSDHDIIEARSYLPSGFALKIQQYKAPKTTRRTYAKTDSEERRLPGNLVRGSHRDGHTQSAQDERHQGPSASQAACA